ncbi:MAG: trypsin-like peptidase domain-containing protein [Gemmatimonadota bacterium]|nr:MAG: trypsin-like peptidase domain-containing protein [Gemmatimonadota bacterium]
MKVQLEVLSGARAGRVAVFSQETIAIGRHPSSDLQFDPRKDLEVSTHHATIVREGTRWLIKDRDSLNGVLLNGHAIAAKTPLDDTDQIRLGADGPAIEFRLVPDSVPDGIRPSTVSRSGRSTGTPTRVASDKSGAPDPASRMTKRIEAEVGRQTRKLRALTGVLVVLLLAVIAAFVYDAVRQRRLRESEIASLQARTDSILQVAGDAVQALQGQVAGLAAALQTSQGDVSQLKADLAAARRSGSAEEVRRLRRQLLDASQALVYQQAAAYVDYGSIVEANQSAVAMMWVEFEVGEVYVGTAFALRSDGYMATSRHVVAGEAGDRAASRIAVKFADSYQVYQARVVAISREADVAVVKVDIPGGVPTVRGLNMRADTLQQGAPVAIVGFPLGPDLPMTASAAGRTIARTSFSAGSISKTLPEILQIDGYGAEGSSGSPIFDQSGEVIGVVFGAEEGSYGRMVVGAPVEHLVRLLESIGV